VAITATTLSGAITSTQTSFGVASATGITAANYQAGTGITVLLIDQEYILVVAAPNGTTLPVVVRGFNGSAAAAHVNGAQVQIGAPTDYVTGQELYTGSPVVASNATVAAYNQPAIFLAGTADAIPAGVAGFYVVKTGSADAMTLAAPTAAQEGNIIDVWSDTLFAHTITATSLLANGTALKTTATFPAFRGAGVRLRACNLVYHVMSNGASAGIVVLS
jgi:hypothetical protein